MAGAPRLVRTPRHGSMPKHVLEEQEVTGQAYSICVRLACHVVLILAVAAILYWVANAFLGGHIPLDCEEQPIEHGVLRRGRLNSTAVVKCDPGYKHVGPRRIHELRCQLIHQTCDPPQDTTRLVEELECVNLFAYTTVAADVALRKKFDKDIVDVPTKIHEEAIAVSKGTTRGVCSTNAPNEKPVFSKSTASWHMPDGKRRSRPLSERSIAPAVLMVLAIASPAVLVASGVDRGCRGTPSLRDMSDDDLGRPSDAWDCDVHDADESDLEHLLPASQ
eukprot:TRINITY_DN6625_c1_g1_i1.p1 TRINITY_DN6625_c1_g1~~TRINITY_DN6625_c1_g1_i1.p1  ORF type:complete len:310 (-),score=44.02 TRINITY_DN6625_c1_g1_i1:84-914(-)